MHFFSLRTPPKLELCCEVMYIKHSSSYPDHNCGQMLHNFGSGGGLWLIAEGFTPKFSVFGSYVVSTHCCGTSRGTGENCQVRSMMRLWRLT